MLEKVKESIELAKKTKGDIYTLGTNLENVIKEDYMIFGLSKNNQHKVFFDAEKAKKWKQDTNGILCNIYYMLGRVSEKEVYDLVSESKDMKADLKTWLKIKGVTQKELSEVLSVSYQTVQSWVRKQSFPNIKMCLQIETELGIDLHQIQW